MRRGLLAAALLLAAASCRNFDEAYQDCLASGHCLAPSDGGGSDAGGRGDAGFSPQRTGLCVDEGALCWESPFPFGFDVEDVYAAAPDEAWFVGAHGAVAHWVGEQVETFALDAGLTRVTGDGTRLLAIGTTSVWDLHTRVGIDVSGTVDRLGAIHAAGEGHVVTAGEKDSRFGVYEVADAGSLQPLFQSQLPSSFQVTSLSGQAGAAVVALSDGQHGQLWWQGSGASRTETPTQSELLAVSLDPAGVPWLGAGNAYLVGTDAGWTTFPFGGAVHAVASGPSATSLATAIGGFRCQSPGACTQTLDGALNATAMAGATQFFAGDRGVMARVDPDGGLGLLSAALGVEVNDALLEDDGGGWATVTVKPNSGQIWRRADGGWQVAASAPGRQVSVFRAEGTLFFGDVDHGLQQATSEVPLQLEADSMVERDGASSREQIFLIRGLGDGGTVATGASGADYRLLPGQGTRAWERNRPPEPAPSAACSFSGRIDAGGQGCAIGTILTLPGGATATGATFGLTGGFVLYQADPAPPHVAYTPVGAAGLTLLTDGGVFACGPGSTLVFEGDLVAGLVTHSFEGLDDGCLQALALQDGRLVIGTTFGFVLVRWDGVHWKVSETHALGRKTNRLIAHGQDVYVVGDLGAILRFHPR